MMTITSLLVLIPSLVSAHMARESNLSEEVSATYWTDEICVVWSQGGFLLLSFLAPFLSHFDPSLFKQLGTPSYLATPAVSVQSISLPCVRVKVKVFQSGF